MKYSIKLFSYTLALIMLQTIVLNAQFSMGTRVCVNDGGKKRTGMITGSGFGADGSAYRITFMDDYSNKSPVAASQFTEGECPPPADATCDCNNTDANKSYVDDFPQEAKANNINLSAFLLEIQAELNHMRSDPKGYAQILRHLHWQHKKQYTNGNTTYHIESAMFANKSNSQNERLRTHFCKYEANYDDEIATWDGKINAAIAALENINGSLSTLTLSQKLNNAADMLSDDTGQINGPAHTDSQGRSAFCRASQAGYQHAVGECLSTGVTKEGVIIGFLSSPGHRNILINAGADEVGIGVGLHNAGNDPYIRVVIMTGDKDGGIPPNPCN